MSDPFIRFPTRCQFSLHGLQEGLAASTLREVALPVCYNLTFFSRADISPRELSLYLQQQSHETDIIVLVVDATGHVMSKAAGVVKG